MPVLRFGKSNISKLKQKSGIPGPAKFKSKSNIPRPKQSRPDFAHDVQAAAGRSKPKIVLPQRVLVNRQVSRKPLFPLQSPAPERILIKNKFQSPAVREIAPKKFQAPKISPPSSAVRVLKIATPTPRRVARKNVGNKKSIHWADETSPLVQDKLVQHLFGETPRTKTPGTSILKKKNFKRESPIRMKNEQSNGDDDIEIEIVSPSLLNTEAPPKPPTLAPNSPPRTPAPILHQSGDVATPVEPRFTLEEDKENFLRTIDEIKKQSPARIFNALTQQKLESPEAVTKQKIVDSKTMTEHELDVAENVTKQNLGPKTATQKVDLKESTTQQKPIVTRQKNLPQMLKADDVVKMMNQQMRKTKRKSVQNIFSGMISQLAGNFNICDVIEEDNEEYKERSSECDAPSIVLKEKVSVDPTESFDQPKNTEGQQPHTNEYYLRKVEELRQETRSRQTQYLATSQRFRDWAEGLDREQRKARPGVQSIEDKVEIAQPESVSKSWDFELRKEANNNDLKVEVQTTENSGEGFNSFANQEPTSKLVFPSKKVFPPQAKMVQPRPTSRIKAPKQRFIRPKPRPSASTLKSRISQHYSKILLDEEVNLLTCRITKQSISEHSKLKDPVAHILSNGDLTHFVPIIPTPSATPQRAAKPVGSAFSNFQK